MTVVFLSGSRKISRLASEVCIRLDNMVEKRLSIIVGDANGADKAMQAYLANKGYRDVTVFYVGEAPRNNLGQWLAESVATGKNLSGRDFYAVKDREMARRSDFGFVLWDGKSPGSVQNMISLSDEGKKLLVYLNPEQRFLKLGTHSELIDFLVGVDRAILDELEKKIALPERLKTELQRQPVLNF